MKNIFKRVLALCLCLVMVAVLLPVSPVEAATVTSDGIVLADVDFSGYDDLDTLYESTVFVSSSSMSNNSSFGDYDSDGKKELRIDNSSKANRFLTYKLSLNLPALDNVDFYLKIEAYVKHETDTGNYMINIRNADSTGVDDGATNFKFMNSGNYVSDAAAGHLAGGEGTVTGYYRVDANCTAVGGRLGMDKNAAGTMLIKSFKITLLPAVGKYASDEFITAMAYDDAYAQLSANTSLAGDLTLGKNAVLDLNGYKLTGSKINVPVGAQIVDTSAEKTGLIAVAEGDLLFANPDYPSLPLWTGEGYILTDPQLGNTRAFFVEGSVSADGFTMDFRPGFGEVGGVNIRETYLANGACGITMDATLSWTDIYGATDSAELACDDIFTGMYSTANHRGRLSLTGAAKYQTISLGITLSSCGVKKNFDMPVFSNADRLKIHLSLANETYEPTGGKGYGPYAFTSAVDTATADKLVMEFNMQADGTDKRVAFRFNPPSAYASDTGAYVGLFGFGYNGDAKLTSDCEGIFARVDSIATTEDVNYKLEINLATGAWVVYENGARIDAGTYPSAEGKTATAAQVLNGLDKVYLRIQDAGTYEINNLVIYTVDNDA